MRHKRSQIFTIKFPIWKIYKLLTHDYNLCSNLKVAKLNSLIDSVCGRSDATLRQIASWGGRQCWFRYGRLVSTVVDLSWLLGGRNHGGMKAGACHNKYSTVSRARWVGALSCWNVKVSPGRLQNGWQGGRQKVLTEEDVTVIRTINFYAWFDECKFSISKDQTLTCRLTP